MCGTPQVAIYANVGGQSCTTYRARHALRVECLAIHNDSLPEDTLATLGTRRGSHTLEVRFTKQFSILSKDLRSRQPNIARKALQAALVERVIIHATQPRSDGERTGATDQPKVAGVVRFAVRVSILFEKLNADEALLASCAAEAVWVKLFVQRLDQLTFSNRLEASTADGSVLFLIMCAAKEITVTRAKLLRVESTRAHSTCEVFLVE